MDAQSSESQKVFGREAGGEGDVGIQLILFQRLCAELGIASDSHGVFQKHQNI